MYFLNFWLIYGITFFTYKKTTIQYNGIKIKKLVKRKEKIIIIYVMKIIKIDIGICQAHAQQKNLTCVFEGGKRIVTFRFYREFLQKIK